MELQDRLARLEVDIASVDQALATLDEITNDVDGPRGEQAAATIAAVVSPERFPVEFGTDEALTQ